MTELIIIKTKNREKVLNLLNKEQISYQVYNEQEQEFSQDDKLLQEYQEAWKDPRRFTEARQWEQASMTDWAERAEKEKK